MLKIDGRPYHLHYYKDGKYVDHGRQMQNVDFKVGAFIHPFHTIHGPVKWKILDIQVLDGVIRVDFEDHGYAMAVK